MNKEAADPALSLYPFSGRLIYSSSGWVLLEIPNALVRGAFMAMDVPGAELPLKDGRLNAHISVMRPEEIERIGGISKINELGKRFRFRLGPLYEVNPLGWKEMDKVWMFRVISPDLNNLRKSYGLNPNPMRGNTELRLHATVAVRRRGVLRNGPVAKASSLVDAFLFATGSKSA